MANKLLAKYINGNYTVKLYQDGTKVKQTKFDEFIAQFPDSMDLKITNYCNLNCPMCHEKSSTKGKHGDLNAAFLKTLKAGTELAIGGGNPLSHQDLPKFLEQMKDQNVICNLTVNEQHLLQNIDTLQHFIDSKLIYGLGISLNQCNEQTIKFAKKNKNVVFHIINGLFTNFEKIANKNLKILILGYKQFGRGKDYYNKDIEQQMLKNKHQIISLFSCFKCISFDNLALKQLEIEKLVPKQTWEQSYMGDDGDSTMYVDLVKKQFAVSSTSTKRYMLLDNIEDMFNIVKKQK